MTQPPITQQVTFIYTKDLAAGSDFMANKVGLDLVLNQGDTCHIFRAAPNAFIGVCTNRPPREAPGVTYTFVTPDVDGMYEALKARGVAFNGPPELSERFNVYSCFFGGIENYRFEVQEFRNPSWPKPE